MLRWKKPAAQAQLQAAKEKQIIKACHILQDGLMEVASRIWESF